MFLRFEDVVAPALLNQLRFPHLYFDSFVELARLGYLVPALDGFEEIFVETSEGEAVSSLGTLIHQMHGEGTLLIAARRAYFEYRGLETQAKLLDAIPDTDVGFGKLRLLRWGREEFLRYCELTNVASAEGLYEGIVARVGSAEHPLLTRPVLVKRLVELAGSLDTDQFLGSLQPETDPYYLRFIDRIIDREAREKWIDKTGDPPQPLLSTGEHHELLSLVAEEMWLGKTSILNSEMLESIADIFCETNKKTPATTRQVRDRLKTHALVVKSGLTRDSFQFDHDDFREFFLGEQLGRYLIRDDPSDVRRILRIDLLAASALDVGVAFALQGGADAAALLAFVQEASSSDGAMSYLRENCGAIALRLAERLSSATITEVTLPMDSLRGRLLRQVNFRKCYFRGLTLERTRLEDVDFEDCDFERIDLASDSNDIAARMKSCDVRCVVAGHNDDFYEVYDRDRIRLFLSNAGFKYASGEEAVRTPSIFDPRLQFLQKVVNTFRRCTTVHENTLRLRLSINASRFFAEVLPDMLKLGVLEKVKHQGSGLQEHYKLGFHMSVVADLISKSGGSYETFVDLARAPVPLGAGLRH